MLLLLLEARLLQTVYSAPPARLLRSRELPIAHPVSPASIISLQEVEIASAARPARIRPRLELPLVKTWRVLHTVHRQQAVAQLLSARAPMDTQAPREVPAWHQFVV